MKPAKMRSLIINLNFDCFRFRNSLKFLNQHHATLIFVIITLIQFVPIDADYSDYEQQSSSSTFGEKTNMPKCQDDRSICGYMQLNKVGLNKIPICSCKKTDCRLTWNLFDKRIIKHGNDFYKFCGSRPNLHQCANNELAYISFGKTNLISGEKITEVQQMKCLCRNDYILKTNKTMFEMTDDFYFYGTEQICSKVPQCTIKQICLSITETANSTIEKKHCRCSKGKYCPKDFRLAHEEIKEDKGTLYNMRCI